jgi:hypothetical protein
MIFPQKNQGKTRQAAEQGGKWDYLLKDRHTATSYPV